jgi:hypothetical protein
MSNSKVTQLLVVTIVFLAITAILVPLRLYTRLVISKSFGYDDAIIVLCTVRSPRHLGTCQISVLLLQILDISGLTMGLGISPCHDGNNLPGVQVRSGKACS